MEVKDSNGNVLGDSDTGTLIKDLKVKGSSLNLMRGTVVKKFGLPIVKMKWIVALMAATLYCVRSF